MANLTDEQLAQYIKVSGLKAALQKYKTEISDTKLAASLKGAANGLAELDSTGKVPSSQLPSYVDDVIEGYYYNSKFYKEAAHTTEIACETGKIYVDLATDKSYRWSGSAFSQIKGDLTLGETSSTAYRGDRGKTAYDHASDANKLTTAQSAGLYKVAVTAQGHVASVTAVAKSDITALGIPGSDTDTKVTSAANHYAPEEDSTKQLDADATGATAAWGIDVVTGITVKRDAKGHVVGIAVDSGKVPAQPTASTVGLGNVGNFKAVSTVASQGLTDTEKSNARANIGAGTSSLTLGTSSSTAYRGDYGNSAYAHAVTNKGAAFASGLYKITTNAEGHVTAATAVAKSDITALGIPGSDTNTVPQGYCDTAAGTASKTAVCTDYTLTEKTYLMVIIKNANSYNGAITLSVNGSTAKPVYINGSASSSSNKTLLAGSYLTYYDGTNFYFRTDGKMTGSITGDAATVGGKTVGKNVPSDALFTDTDTKVTSVGNHYAPSADSSAALSASASGASAAWSIDVVKAVQIQRDAKGHVTGVTVTSGKIPANPNTDTKVTAVGNHYTPSGGTDMTTSEGDASAASAGSTYAVVTGVTLTTDAAGHVTGVATTRQNVVSNQATDISGKADKSATVSTVEYDTTNKKITKTINGTKTDVVTASTIVTDGGGIKSHQSIKQDGVSGATVNRFGTCSTAATTAAKTVSITNGTFNLETGASVRVKFSNANTASTPTLAVGNTAAKNIFHNGTKITTGGNKALLAGVCDFVYDGTQYHLVGNYIDTNTQAVSSVVGQTGAVTAAQIATALTNAGNKLTDTDTKVTAVGNHYTPAEDSSVQLDADASSSTAATWGSTQLVTGVTIKRDAKGHVTGLAVDSIKMPSNPNSNTTYKLNINGTWNGGGSTSLGTVYAPTAAGTSGQILVANGSGVPSWASAASDSTCESIIDELS